MSNPEAHSIRQPPVITGISPVPPVAIPPRITGALGPPKVPVSSYRPRVTPPKYEPAPRLTDGRLKDINRIFGILFLLALVVLFLVPWLGTALLIVLFMAWLAVSELV